MYRSPVLCFGDGYIAPSSDTPSLGLDIGPAVHIRKHVDEQQKMVDTVYFKLSEPTPEKSACVREYFQSFLARLSVPIGRTS
jgi:hypothetical protein